MTEIRWYCKDNECWLRAVGHAGYHAGNDIVCASISALCQTLRAGMEEYCGAEIRHRQESGRFEIGARIEPEKQYAAVALFYSIILGLELIGREYPNHVNIAKAGEGERFFDFS